MLGSALENWVGSGVVGLCVGIIVVGDWEGELVVGGAVGGREISRVGNGDIIATGACVGGSVGCGVGKGVNGAFVAEGRVTRFNDSSKRATLLILDIVAEMPPLSMTL